MGSLSIWHWVIVLIIVMLMFGTKKLRNVGQDMGGAIKGFKQGMKEGTVIAKQVEDQVVTARETNDIAAARRVSA